MEKKSGFFKGFWNFYRLTSGGWGAPKQVSLTKKYIFFEVITIISAILISSQLNIFDYFPMIIVPWIAAINIGMMTAVKPSLISVAPYTPTQRVVFTIMSAVLTLIIMLAAILVISWLVLLIGAFFAYVIANENVIAELIQGMLANSSSMGLRAVFGAYMFFSVLALTHIEKQKWMITASVGCFVFNEIVTLIIANVFGDKMSNSSSFLTWIDLDEALKRLAHPWMLYVIFGVMAAAACGISIWLMIRRHKSSKI